MEITATQAAEIIGISPAMVRVYLQKGRLKGYKPGRDWLVKAHDARAFKRAPVGYPKGKPRANNHKSE
jgi:excisionase family DNA binding protein